MTENSKKNWISIWKKEKRIPENSENEQTKPKNQESVSRKEAKNEEFAQLSPQYTFIQLNSWSHKIIKVEILNWPQMIIW